MSDGLRSCTTVDGRTIALSRTRFVVRPSVYARVIHAGAVLLVTNTRSGRFYLPGGGVEQARRLQKPWSARSGRRPESRSPTRSS